MALDAVRHLGLKKETTWGTPVTVDDYIPFLSESFNKAIEQINEAAQKGIIDEHAYFEGQHEIKGNIEFNARPNSLGHILRALLGAPVTTQPDVVNSPTVFQHVFTPLQSLFSDQCPIPPYTFEIYRGITGSNTPQIAGACLNKFQMEFGPEQKLIKCTTEWIAKQLALISKTTPTFETPNPFNWSQAVIKIAGNTVNNLQSFSIAVNNGLDPIYTLNNTKLISRIARGEDLRNVEVGFVLDFQDTVEYNNFVNQSEQAFQIVIDTGQLIEDTYNYKLTIDMPKVRYKSIEWNAGGVGKIQAAVGAMAKYSDSDGFAIKFTLINSKSAY